jgi:hypothetical protein
MLTCSFTSRNFGSTFFARLSDKTDETAPESRLICGIESRRPKVIHTDGHHCSLAGTPALGLYHARLKQEIISNIGQLLKENAASESSALRPSAAEVVCK